MRSVLFAVIAASIPLARAHIRFSDPSTWGHHVRAEDFPYDNRPETPLQQYAFKQWWFHGHLDYPPAEGMFFELPAGGTAISQLACNLGATKFWADSDGSTDIRQGEYPCPGYPLSQFHGQNDLKGCALSIAYTSDVNSIKPEDLAIFSVNHECVWKVSTPFQIPKDMPACPEGGCICAWHWIHSVDSGSAQMYMNGFRCKVTGSTSNTPIATPVVPKRCTGDLSKCNQGAQQPLYWYQAEGNNMFNGQYDPPYYLDEWGFTDGAQNGIFQESGNDTNNLIGTTPTSTLADMPSSTPLESSPSSTPRSDPSSTPKSDPSSTPRSDPSSSPPRNDPSSTPVGDKPIPTPTPTPTGGYSGDLPKPSSSSSQGYGEGNIKTSTSDPHPPTPSKTQQCKPRKGKKRSELPSRHFQRKRHQARELDH